MRYLIRYLTHYLTGMALIVVFPAIVCASLVNINTADTTLLDTLPGIGPSKAAAIIDYRTKHGPFSTIHTIQNVSGIGPVTFSKLKPYITVEVQPSPPSASYTKVQTARPDEAAARQVEPISSTNIQTHDNEVQAPATTTELAAAGAALPPVEPKNLSDNVRAFNFLHSPWLFGLLGVIVLSGGIFVFL